MFNPEHCSPSNDKKISCITLKLLRKIARIIKNKVGEPIKISSGKKELYDNISTIMSKLSKCSSEPYCLTSNARKASSNNPISVILSIFLSSLNSTKESIIAAVFIFINFLQKIKGLKPLNQN